MSLGSESGLVAGRLVVDDILIGANRWRVATRKARNGDPPLLLCNGIGVNWELFKPFINAIADRGFIAFDVPGVGGSAMPASQYSLETLARDVTALLDRLDVGTVDVLGVSWGGALAQQLALQLQGRCRRLVLAATSTGFLSFPGKLPALIQLADARRFNDVEHAVSVLPLVYGGSLRDNTAALREFVRHLQPPGDGGYSYQMNALTGWTSVWWLPVLRQRTLILAGADDPLVPLANAHLLKSLICRSELHVVDDGHLFLHTRANEVAGRVDRFLAD